MRKLALWTVVVAVLTALVATNVHAQRAAGTVKLGGTDKSMAVQLLLPNKIKVTVTTKGTKFPVGTYTPKAYMLMKRDRSGKIWKATCRGGLGSLSTFTVSNGGTTVLEPGTDIVVSAVVFRMSRRGGRTTIPIGLSIGGKGGESYDPSVRVGSRRVPPPLFQILDENEKVLAQGKFDYG